MTPKRCQYGAIGPKCDQPATTKRPKPGPADVTWAVCDRHAAFLDRLQTNITKHAELLRKLADR